MTEHQITVTIRTDEEYAALHTQAFMAWRTEEQQLNAEVERLLKPKVERKQNGTGRGGRRAQQAA
jgi:riboflavin synthase